MEKRIKASLSDKPAPTATGKATIPIESNDPVNDPFGDTERMVSRYRNSLDQLKEALKLAQGQWKAFQFSELESIPEDIDPSRLRQAINNVFKSTERKVKSPSRWAKCKRVIECAYTALSPIVKNMLAIGRDSSALNPYGVLFEGLLVLMLIADRELERAADIENQLDYISRQLGQLEILENLPNVNVPSQNLLNSALEVRAAVMRYLAVMIRYESKASGVMGKVAVTFLKGEEERNEASTALETAVRNFNFSLSHYGHGVGFKAFEYVEDIRQRLMAQDINANIAPPPFTKTFLVPYEENPHFVGRKELLKALRMRLCDVEPKTYNHRIALHGLGGVGKTQTALAYVYTHKSDYESIYWITGVNQASLLSGFQDIAKSACLLKVTVDSQPAEVAKTVLSWLGSQNSWLLVIDNLDDFSAVKGFLPPRDSGKHTIITTRNPNVYEIPAEGMEIDVLGPQDATELLIIRSKLPAKADSEQVLAEAKLIVKELGYLALAIEQAAAFIRETSKNIFKFLPSYRADRKKHHARIPRGNWEYSKAVGTTWRLSFQQIEQNNVRASELLRLLAFLNPDGILLEFLERGKDGLPDLLRDLVSDIDEFYEALSELERFSLIRRQDDGVDDRITIHRLVQCVIKDDMDDNQFSSMTASAITLCAHAFPQHWDKEMRLVCRKFQEQVVVTLSEVKILNSEALFRILKIVGTFLQEDGKYEQAAELRLKVVDISTMVNGREHRDTLKAMGQVAETYRHLRLYDDSIELYEKALETSIRVLGKDHVDTWTAMGDLAATYRTVGRREEAITMQEKVLDARMKTLGEEHPDTLRAMGNLGATYRSQGRLKEAALLQEKVLELRLKIMGDEHPETLRAMINFAITCRFQRDSRRAAQLEERVVDIRKNTLGLEHPDTLDAMRNLAASYTLQKRWDEALKLQETVLKTRIRVMGGEHPETLWALASVAETYCKQGKYHDAVALQENVLNARRRQMGNFNRETVIAMKKLAKTYSSLRRWAEAAKLQKEVVQAREQILGVDNNVAE